MVWCGFDCYLVTYWFVLLLFELWGLTLGRLLVFDFGCGSW